MSHWQNAILSLLLVSGLSGCLTAGEDLSLEQAATDAGGRDPSDTNQGGDPSRDASTSPSRDASTPALDATVGLPDTGTPAIADAGTSSVADAGGGGQVDGGGVLPDAGGGGGAKAFAAVCLADAECQTGLICRTVGMSGQVCTKTCVADADCPAGSQGPKCNQMGLCRP